jgi:hypothetical protein
MTMLVIIGRADRIAVAVPRPRWRASETCVVKRAILRLVIRAVDTTIAALHAHRRRCPERRRRNCL